MQSGPSPREEGHLYPIRTVATLTGVNPVTLRAWERRYGLVRPRRTGKGHRLYSADDIERVRRIVDMLGEGIPVSRVATALAAPPGMEREERPSEVPAEIADVWEGYRARMLDAVARFAEAPLDAVYSEALSLYPVDVVTTRLICPVLAALGARWSEREAGIAEEHFFGVYLRNKVGARFHHLSTQASGPRLVAACLPGERHETGLLLFSLSAAARGYRPILLGADLPLEQVAMVAARTGARAVVLSGSVEPAPEVLATALPALTAGVRVPVLVGGPVSVRHRARIEAAGAMALGQAIQTALARIDQAVTG
ncbi:MAG: MerR family transcriptional regulator [Ectothiorhodospiraceae bacterium]|nr:MerR family transcriptional regulator [Ectothiorhodospiraceae bacterium]